VDPLLRGRFPERRAARLFVTVGALSEGSRRSGTRPAREDAPGGARCARRSAPLRGQAPRRRERGRRARTRPGSAPPDSRCEEESLLPSSAIANSGRYVFGFRSESRRSSSGRARAPSRRSTRKPASGPGWLAGEREGALLRQLRKVRSLPSAMYCFTSGSRPVEPEDDHRPRAAGAARRGRAEEENEGEDARTARLDCRGE